jgi:adenylylsulfate kinase-like enzyme
MTSGLRQTSRDARTQRYGHQGASAEFTGVSSPYEAPMTPDLVIDTEHLDVETAVGEPVAYMGATVPLVRGTASPRRLRRDPARQSQ